MRHPLKEVEISVIPANPRDFDGGWWRRVCKPDAARVRPYAEFFSASRPLNVIHKDERGELSQGRFLWRGEKILSPKFKEDTSNIAPLFDASGN